MTVANTRRVLLIGLGHNGRPYVSAAHRLGVAVTVVDTAPILAAAESAGLFDHDDVLVPAHTPDTDQQWYLAARRAADLAPVSAVLAFSEPHVIAAALIADELGLAGPGLFAATVSRSKALQRVLFECHGLAQPRFHLVNRADDAAQWAGDRLPVVCKPINGTGSRGVVLVSTSAQLEQAVAEAEPGGTLLEEFLDAPEGSCEALVSSGRLVFVSLTDKTTGPLPHFTEISHTVPGPLAEAARAQIEELAAQAVAVLSVRDAIVHMEYRLTPAGPTLIELAVRTPGDRLMELVEHAWGVDLYEALIRLTLREPIGIEPRHHAWAASWFVTAPDGIVTDVAGVTQTAALDGVRVCVVKAAPGDVIENRGSSADRLGVVVVAAPSLDSLRDRLDTVSSTIRVNTTPHPLPVGE